MRPTVIALHGDGANGALLARDMGYPPWVDHYWNGDDGLLEFVRSCESVVIVGYSRGTQLAGRLSLKTNNIIGCILYEPMLKGMDSTGGIFPVLWIENDRGRKEWKEMKRAKEVWARTHPMTEKEGKGRHWSIRLWRFPFRGHEWDQSLNAYCFNWIKGLNHG